MEQKRNQLLDIAKGVAIILVVWGHALQQYSGLDQHTTINLWMERFLISFHMPLFMLISGYLFYFSLQRHTESDIVKVMFRMFILPILTMSVIRFLRHNLKHFSLSNLWDFPLTLPNTLWFFWAMLIITLLMCLVHRWFKDSIVGYIAILGATMLLPNVYPIRAYISLYPTFVTGYLFAKWRVGYSGAKSLVWQIVLLVVLVSLFAIMLRHFDYDDMIYFSRYSLLGATDIWQDTARDIFRFAIGLVGSLMVLLCLHICLLTKILNSHLITWLSSLGSMTFGTYVFQDLMLSLLTPFIKYLDSHYYIINAVVFFIIILTASIALTRYAKTKKYASWLFLGQKPIII